MLHLKKIHHVAIICSNFSRSKHFYTNILGFTALREVYREERDSYKLDLAVGGHYQIELFSFPGAPSRPSWPEAQGLRHLAFEVEDIGRSKQYLEEQGVTVEEIRVDPHTGKRFTFFADPDALPLELYES